MVLLMLLPTLSGCLALAGARGPDDVVRGRPALHRIVVQGVRRSYVLTVPAASAASRPGPVPLVLAFHGHRGSGGLLRYASGLDAAAQQKGWAVAYLNGTGPLRLMGLSWNAATCCGDAQAENVNDIGFVHALIDTLARRGVIDSSRVFATGFSVGGMLALRLACEQRPVVRAVADVAGAMPDTNCTARRRLPVLLVRGDQDLELVTDHAAHRARNNNRFATSFTGAQRFWAQHNGCSDGVTIDSTPLLVTITSEACAPGAPVEQVIIHGLAHEWPGGRTLNRLWPHRPKPVNGAALVLEFFERATGVAR